MKLRKIVTAFICAMAALSISLGGCVANCGEPSADTSNPGQESPEAPGNEPSTPGETPEEKPEEEPEEIPAEPFYSGMYNTSKVGYAAEYLGTVARVLPQVSDGGLERYPVYGTTLSGASAEEKSAILAENSTLVASADAQSAGTYDSMDADGNLCLNGSPTGQKLYKHTAAAGMYYGNVSDDEQAVVKRITCLPRPSGNLMTGLYAPAGEVVKIEMSAEDLAKTGGLVVYIGQYLSNSAQNNIWTARDFNRMPLIGNKMAVSAETAYVGSFLGGPIYIAPKNTDCGQFAVTISGGVNYPHYIHGYTTREEFERNKNSSAPYFDLEVWDNSVRHSGPASCAAQFSYDELRDAAMLWDKISRVSKQVPTGSRADTGIIFLYDPFVAAGSMVAFVGRNTVNCPTAVLTAALDARSAIENASGNFWGAIHEFNHHFQRFGFHPGDEVTNNAVSLVEYSLFTRISSNRSLGSAAQGSYADGWNRYTNPAWVLSQTLSNGGVNSALDSYANLLYAFGQEKFVQATRLGGGNGGADAWYRAVSDAAGYDMTYYFTEVLRQTVSADVLAEYAAKNNPVYVPVATIFQTGSGHISGGQTQYTTTTQPYAIRAGQDFELDFNSNVVVPEGFTVKVKNLTLPAHGRLEKREEGVYVYTPASDNSTSGAMYLTLGITRDDGAFEVEDVKLVIELEPTYSNAPITRTTYLYDSSPYSTATAAYEAGYAGYSSVTVADNANRIQNGNCEIWEPGYPGNAAMELSGKVYIPSDGKYRFALRGRYFAALYISLDGTNYTLAGQLENAPRTDQYFMDDPATYTDLDLQEGQYVYFKEVLLVTSPEAYIGLGMGKFSGDSVTVSHVTDGLHVNYQPRADFTSDYYYPREYAFDYAEVAQSQTLISSKYSPWDESYSIENLFDDNLTNFIHSDRTPISADNPFEMTVDLGQVVRANTFTIYGEPSRQYQPKNFVLYGGATQDDMHVIATVEGAERSGNDVKIDFEEEEIRYYRLVVTDTYDLSGNKYIAFRRAQISWAPSGLSGGIQLSPDTLSYSGKWQISSQFSTFGHIYVADNASAQFTFTGTNFGIMSFDGADCTSFDVYIDGAFVATVNYSGSEATKLVYASPDLAPGEHTVELRSSGPFNVDSVVVG